MNQTEYREQCRSVAKDIFEEHAKNGDCGQDLTALFEEEEWVDQHEWIIYPRFHPYILAFGSSDAENYWNTFENFGCRSINDGIQEKALFTLEFDIRRELNLLCEVNA
jgi:hypothetical protein